MSSWTAQSPMEKGASFTDTVYRTLHGDLVMGRVAPGGRLKPAELASGYGVSLAVVREALSRLSSEELVEARPQHGFRAMPVSADHLLDLTAARIDIEGSCLAQSVANFDLLADLRLDEAMEAMLATSVAAPGGTHAATAAWIAAHATFHEALAGGCRNAVLRRIRRQLFMQSERYRCLAMSAKTVADVERDHRPLLDAVKRRDGHAARAAMTEHIEGTTRTLLGRMRDGDLVVPRG